MSRCGLRARRAIFHFICMICLCALSVKTAHALDFLRAMNDIPIPDGLTETRNTIEFDTPYGRIVESAARGEGQIEAIQSFYMSSLPPLGWEVSESDSAEFVRGQETLNLSFSHVDGQVSVHYRLVVQPAPSMMKE